MEGALWWGLSDSDTDHEVEGPVHTDLTHTYVIHLQDMLGELRRFALLKDDRFLGPLMAITEQTILVSKMKQKQSTIDQFVL